MFRPGGFASAQVELVAIPLNDKGSSSKENLDHLYDGDLSSSFSTFDESASDVEESCEKSKQAKTCGQAKPASNTEESCESSMHVETSGYRDECD